MIALVLYLTVIFISTSEKFSPTPRGQIASRHEVRLIVSCDGETERREEKFARLNSLGYELSSLKPKGGVGQGSELYCVRVRSCNCSLDRGYHVESEPCKNARHICTRLYDWFDDE